MVPRPRARQGARGVVTLEMGGTNQRGEITVSGTAEVVLPTR